MGRAGNLCGTIYQRRVNLVKKGLASWYLPYQKVEDIDIEGKKK